jgi:hypothetical protein
MLFLSSAEYISRIGKYVKGLRVPVSRRPPTDTLRLFEAVTRATNRPFPRAAAFF